MKVLEENATFPSG